METDLDTLLAKLAATPRRKPPIETFTGTRRFEIRRRLGGGAFGDVFEARDREHGTLVALKSLKSSHPEWIYRFKREFRLVGDLAHPNIARLYELFCEDDRWYLTMELIDGLPFDAHVDRSPAELRSCFAQLAQGLHALHGAGCLHRDVKPSNALVESTGRVVLLDFGLSRAQQGADRTAIAGTPPFMAPELGMGGRPSPASDWYAFGVMLYHALAGELPFRGTRTQVLTGKLAGDPPPPSATRKGVDRSLERLALRLLAPSSADRPGPEEILTALADEPPRRARKRHAQGAAICGRAGELAELSRALDNAAASIPVMVSIRGEAGMGKSTLLDAFADVCRRRGVQLYTGRCYENESVPYKGLDGCVDALCDDLVRRPHEEVAAVTPRDADALVQMFPVLKRVPAFARARRDTRVRSPQEARRVASRALRELLLRMSAQRPIVLMIDDLHWADDDGLRLLNELVAPPAPPLLTIIAHRDLEPGQASRLAELLAGVKSEQAIQFLDIPVHPLDSGGVASLLADRGAASVELNQAMQETGGHPYLLSRLLETTGWSSAGAIDLGAMLIAEIDALEPSARAVLEAVALAAVPISEAAAFAAAGVPPDPAIIDGLRRTKLIQRTSATDDAPLETYHDRVRENTVGALPREREAALHLRLAEVLERRGRIDAEALAHHYGRGGDRGRALSWCRRAARKAAESLAFARAAELLSKAVELAGDDSTRRDLLGDLADAWVHAGRRGDAGEACLEAAAIAARSGDEDAALALRGRAGQEFLLGGRLERGFELLEQVLRAVGMELPTTPVLAVAHSINLGGALATRGLEFEPRDAAEVDPRLLRGVDLALGVASAISLTDIRAPWIATRALLDALELGEPVRIQRALAFFALNNSARAPDHPLIIDALDRSFRMGRELGEELGLAWCQFARGLAEWQRDQLIEALEHWRDAERRFLTTGRVHAREAALVRIATVGVCANFGLDPAWARAAAPDLTAEAVARDDRFAANWSRLLRCWVAFIEDDPDAAQGHLDELRREWPTVADSLFAATALLYEVAIDLYRDPPRAWETFERVTPAYRQMFSSVIATPRRTYSRYGSSAALAALRAGLADRATTVSRIRPLYENISRLDYGATMTSLTAADLCAAEGDEAGQIAHLERAMDAAAKCRQVARTLAIRHRLCELRGDRAGLEACAEDLREIGVGNPARFTVVTAGIAISSS